MTGIRGVIFTSVHGVEAYLAQSGPLRPCYVVGAKTARAARAEGITVHVIAVNAANLIDEITAHEPRAPLLHIRGVHARGAVAETLSQRGIAVKEAIIYDQPAIPLTAEAQAALSDANPVIVPLFSPRTAALLAKFRPKPPLLVAAFSQAVANELLGLHITELRIASRPDSDAMAVEVIDLLARAQAKRI
jgi:uroporphyrinogen-III synthase